MTRDIFRRTRAPWLVLAISLALLLLLAACGRSSSGARPALTPTPAPAPFPTPTTVPTPIPTGLVSTPGEAWELIVESFRDLTRRLAQGQIDGGPGVLAQPKRLYVQQFQKTALTLALESHQRVAVVFQEAEGALQRREVVALQQAGIEMDAILTSIAFKALDDALTKGDAGQMTAWFTVMVRKFHLGEKPSALTILVIEGRRNPDALRSVAERIRSTLLLLLVEQVQAGAKRAPEEPAGGGPRAREKALEVTLLYQVVQGRVREELGAEEEGRVTAALTRLQSAAAAGDTVGARDAAGAVQARLAPLVERLRTRL